MISPGGVLGLREAFRDAVLVTVGASLVGLLSNLVRSEPIPFFAEQPYEILVPCPEPGGAVTVMEPDETLLVAPETFLIDARSEEDHDAWRLRDAVNVPFDYLDPTPEEVMEDLARRTARSRAPSSCQRSSNDRAHDRGTQERSRW